MSIPSSWRLSTVLKLGFLVLLAALILALVACKGPEGPKGDTGAKGDPGVQGVQGLKGDKGDPGAPGKDAPLPAGTVREVDVKIEVSKPANGTHFVAGEAPVVTVNLNDKLGGKFTKDDFGSLNLYMYGPQETTKTKTAVKMLNAETDRSKTPHHYINLLTNADAKADGNKVTYNLKPVSDEEAGTYIASVWAVSKASGLQQAFPVSELQIGTATVEKQIVDQTKCAQCHLGADSGKYYFAHTDVGRSPVGNWAIDSMPVRTCKSCHNTAGYSGYNGLPGAPASTDPNLSRVPDPIVRRVHGVHMGEGLKHVFDTDPDKGDFADYIHVVFPANVRNCTYCHLDDRYKTQPSRLACGACHDNIWFGTEAEIPAEMKEHKMELHPGGPQANDQLCSACHQAEGTAKPSVAGSHKVAPPAYAQKVELAMSAPANGKFYVAGEKPTVTITVKDAKTDAVIDPKNIVAPKAGATPQPTDFGRGYLFVSGPRDTTKPVLTAKASELGPTAGTYASNDFRILADASKMDARFTRTATSVTYQLDDVKGLKPGTYTAWAEVKLTPADKLGSWGVMNFQVGTETAEKKVATNCTQCHGDTVMHATFFAVKFDTDICKSCHDYQRQITGKSGWTNAPGTPAASNQGYGSAPIARRVHGVHRGRYLDKPEEVHRTVSYAEVIFPQDIRNCGKCHDPATTTTTWKERPSRVACLACHDSDKAITHAALQTTDPTPGEPYSGDEVETCAVCHGKGRDFSPDKVHNISNPYKPPYPREPAE